MANYTGYTIDELNALEKAIAMGVEEVQYADRRKVKYRSLADMRSLQREMREALGLFDTPRNFVAVHTRSPNSFYGCND